MCINYMSFHVIEMSSQQKVNGKPFIIQYSLKKVCMNLLEIDGCNVSFVLLIFFICFFSRRSNSESSLERLVKSIEESENLSIKTRLKQFTDDTMVTNGSHDHGVRRKGRPASKAFDFFESQGIIIGQVTFRKSLLKSLCRPLAWKKTMCKVA